MTENSIVMEKIMGGAGLIVFFLLAWCCSENRWKVNLRIVVTGILLQFLIGFIFLKTTIGQGFFWGANRFFTRVVEFSNEGSAFLFGKELVTSALAFSMLPTIIFVSTLSAILFHLGIIQKLVQFFAWVMVRVMNVSGLESLATSANVYIGMTEAPLVIRPYLATATRSEYMAIMTGGMATIAGGVMAAYIQMGAGAGHLLTASLMSAPAALAIAKIMVPETEVSPTFGTVRISPKRAGCNLLDSICIGASEGLSLALNVGVMLLAMMSLIYMLNWCLTIVPDINGSPLTLQRVFGWLFAPLAALMGVSSEDIYKVGQLLGEKTILNEFIAYSDLTTFQKAGEISQRSFVIAQYALCGFANFGSMAIMIGGIGQLVPERREDLARLAFRSLIAGTLACFSTACIAGLFL